MKFPDLSKDTGGKFVKMKSGDRLVGLFVGDPVMFDQHWVEGKSQNCTGPNCPHCEAGEKASTRFHINFLTKEEDVWVAKVFEQGKKTLKTLAAFHEEYDLEKTLVSVTKQGEKMTTVYNLLPAKVNLTEAELKKVRAIPLNKLGKQEAGAAPAVMRGDVIGSPAGKY
jgi:hypothetical protein